MAGILGFNLIFFLAPLAALALYNLGVKTGRLIRSLRPVRGLVAVLAGTLAVLLVWVSLVTSERLVTFYPDLTPALTALRSETARVKTVLADDSALRYYLYPQLPTEQVTDPFHIDYQGKHGLEGYGRAISDRYLG